MVEIKIQMELDTLLSIPIEGADIITLSNALGTFVAWQVELIVLESMVCIF